MDEYTIEVTTFSRSKKPWEFRFPAKIDTGAKRTSIDETLAELLQLKSEGEIKVSNAMGKQERPLVKIKIIHEEKEYNLEASVTNRKKLSYPMILGRDFLALWKTN